MPSILTPLPTSLTLSESLWKIIQTEAADRAQETGGKALGRFFSDGSIVACLPIPAGPAAQATAGSFCPDIGFQEAAIHEAILHQPRLRWVLDWHSHPNGPCSLSEIDLLAAKRMLAGSQRHLVFLVVTYASGQPIPNAWFVQMPENGPPIVKPLPVSCTSNHDPKVQWLFESLEPFPRILILDRVLEQLDRVIPTPVPDFPSLEPTSSSPSACSSSVCPTRQQPVFGRIRWNERLVQILALEPQPGLEPIGRAVWDILTSPVLTESEIDTQNLEMPCSDPEVRLRRDASHWRATVSLGGRAVELPLEVQNFSSWTARNEGLTPLGLQGAHVVLVGLGSVGAPIATQLVQAGISHLTLLDLDQFSLPNLARHPGTLHDLGRLKQHVVADQLKARIPDLDLYSPALDVRCFDHQDALLEILRNAQLCIVSTDDPTANLAASRLCHVAAIPALFVGVFEGGVGSEIFAQSADAPGCYHCMAAFRADLPPLPRAYRVHDYLNLRAGADLPPLNALAIDISHTVSIAASLALGLLGEPKRLEVFAGAPALFIANACSSWIFTRPFEVIPARLETVGCPVCAPLRSGADVELAPKRPSPNTRVNAPSAPSSLIVLEA